MVVWARPSGVSYWVLSAVGSSLGTAGAGVVVVVAWADMFAARVGAARVSCGVRWQVWWWWWLSLSFVEGQGLGLMRGSRLNWRQAVKLARKHPPGTSRVQLVLQVSGRAAAGCRVGVSISANHLTRLTPKLEAIAPQDKHVVLLGCWGEFRSSDTATNERLVLETAFLKASWILLGCCRSALFLPNVLALGRR